MSSGRSALFQERQHRDDDEQGFEAFAEQDRERAEKRGRTARLVRRERSFRFIEQGLYLSDLRADLIGVAIGRYAGAKLPHLLLDLGQQSGVAGAQHRLDRLEAVEIGGERQALRLVAVSGAIGGKTSH